MSNEVVTLPPSGALERLARERGGQATSLSRFEFWSAVLASAITVVTFGMAVMTRPKSGPFCVQDCVTYPYTDIAAHIPGDFLWMYPALAVAPLFVLLTAIIHNRSEADHQLLSGIGVVFAAMAAALLTSDYFMQLRVVQPAALKGEVEGLAQLSQYNPHGVFIALEEAGYLLMAIAFLFAGLAVTGGSRPERALRSVLIGGFALVFVALIGFSAVYRFDVEYRFEVAAISIDWTVLIGAGALLALLRGPGHRS